MRNDGGISRGHREIGAQDELSEEKGVETLVVWKQSQAVLRMSDEQMGGDVVVCNVANIMMVMKMEISSDSSGHNQTEMKAKIGR